MADIKRGIDISAHKGDIDLKSLKNDIDFVIIRVGYGVKGTIDKKFKRNADLCVQLGIPIGFYWYSYALDVEGARKEALAFLNAIDPYKNYIKYGCWFDMEDADDYKKINGMPSNQTLREMCAMFCKIVESSGYYTGIYASKDWFDNRLNSPETAPYDKWVAQWPTSKGKEQGLAADPNSKTNYSLWQFTSKGKFNGYSGYLDTNYAYKSFPNPEQASTQEPAPTPIPEPTPTLSHNIDEVVTINGVYASSIGDIKLKPSITQGKITKILPNARNPYLLNNGDIVGSMTSV